MKIIVTGALGHIGSYVVRDLASQFPEAEIVMIDNMMTQRFPSLFNLPVNGKYRFIEADVTRMDLLPLLDNAYVVIHLAAITDAAGSFGNAAQLEANNYTGTMKVAQACSETDTRMIALSSTSVYGTQNEVVAEDCLPEELNPQSPYATTKLKEEELISMLCKEKKLKAISCRFGTIYGTSPGMRFHTAVNKFCWQAAMGQPITVWRTAYDQKRPYLDLFDASRAFSFIIRNDLFDGRIYNVLTQNATVRQIVEIIREFVPQLEVKFVDNEIMNQLSYEVSCERFLSKGFIFTGDLRRGVGETIGLLRNTNIKAK
jgi:nucleoside-diphosphate-sugar epimerase